MEIFKKYSKWFVALIFAIILIAVYKTFDNFNRIIEIIKLTWSALTPFVIGFVIAYIFNMPCKKIDAMAKKSKYKFLSKNSKPISIILVYAAALLLLYIVIRSIVPALYKNVLDLYYNVPKYFDEVISALVTWQEKHDITLFEVDKLTATNAFNNILNNIDVTQFSKYAQGVIKVTSGVMNILIGVIASVYMLIEKENIIALSKRVCRLIFKEETAEKLIEDVAKINDIFSKYIFCLLLDAVMMTVLSTIILSLLRVKYAIILGALIGICNLIPYFGAIIAGISSVLITLITGGLLKAIWAAIALAILQQVDGNFIGPKIMGNVLNISPLWIIFAVTLGGGLFGVGGMVISVPVFMVVKMIFAEVAKRLEARKVSNEDE
ncbi:MAG: AI-2E family transporter [Clostridia bacterium]|nr:AI-2E family transporter [Clostridia bacterium]